MLTTSSRQTLKRVTRVAIEFTITYYLSAILKYSYVVMDVQFLMRMKLFSQGDSRPRELQSTTGLDLFGTFQICSILEGSIVVHHSSIQTTLRYKFMMKNSCVHVQSL